MLYLRALVPTIHRMLACRNSQADTRTARSVLFSARSAACELRTVIIMPFLTCCHALDFTLQMSVPLRSFENLNADTGTSLVVVYYSRGLALAIIPEQLTKSL